MLQVSELSARHDTASFDRRRSERNNYLRQIAGQHLRKSLARMYVACGENDPGRIVAYYSLNGCEMTSEELPHLFRKNFRAVYRRYDWAGSRWLRRIRARG